LVLTDWIGIFGGLLTTGSLVPQVIRVFKLRSAREISLTYTTANFAGILVWLGYGLVLKLPPVIVWNVVAAVLTFLLFYSKLKFGRKDI
jgi:MtN3 and saliva related transmembrane protein